ncbi:hypothetical protein PHLCEN_2v5454 [Hermanssonia centrifuga]|uniref:Uncharacterized protein n=1 Tax=Hermanssonia centrifuga TaxID=98765 RepID=A0A2R6P2C7_9APHY|nr:hypothetical protein PHLCEN_2v5454 [Hermanssonia centrifuga]
MTADGVVAIIQALTPILISRFLLNLRQLGEPENGTEDAPDSRLSIPGFRIVTLTSIVGNMGEELNRLGTEEDAGVGMDSIIDEARAVVLAEGASWTEEIMESSLEDRCTTGNHQVQQVFFEMAPALSVLTMT